MPHTPGPWRIGDNPFDVIAEEYLRVATVASDQQGLNRGRETSLANARLIAAAPELLQELTYAAHVLSGLAGVGVPVALSHIRTLLARIEKENQ